MGNTQSIIVYRNPVEQAFWEGAAGANFIPFLAGIIVFFAVFLALEWLVGLRWTMWNRPKITNATLAIGALAGMYTVYVMWV
jgi:hypothetical protein